MPRKKEAIALQSQTSPPLYTFAPGKAALSAPEVSFSFADAFPMPGVILEMGERGSGKTATAFWVMEQYYRRSGGKIGGAVAWAPKTLRRMLPEWVQAPQAIANFPHNAVTIIDEAQRKAHARRAAKDENLEMEMLVSLSRQRHQLIILICHHARKLDVLTVLDVDRIIWKQPSAGHALFDRPEIRPFTQRAIRAFSEVQGDPRKRAYIGDFKRLRFGMVTTSKPSYWTEEMSYAMANLGQGG